MGFEACSERQLSDFQKHRAETLDSPAVLHRASAYPVLGFQAGKHPCL